MLGFSCHLLSGFRGGAMGPSISFFLLLASLRTRTFCLLAIYRTYTHASTNPRGGRAGFNITYLPLLCSLGYDCGEMRW
ncbi:uncharacterized protein BKA78DRAFT_107212 [Phyllosticta capitalensis]|uniref:uncharacterized protein n=1 Tax=Phyllosticta capitalensis TaxID=121624 RepID=UPI0031304359